MNVRYRSASAALALLVLTGCGAPAASPAPGLDPEFAQLISTLSGDGDPTRSPIDEFWHTAAPAYETPTSVTGYRAGEVPEAMTCGDHDGPDSWRNNAFYCPRDRTIAFDIDWLHELYQASGALAPIGIIAHEWGHHVQEQTDVGEYSIQDELMADCLAGMFASATDEAATNADQMVAFYELGNRRYQSSTWFQALEHGSPNQRAAAWALGYLNVEGTGIGLPTCRGYAEWEPGLVTTLGTYRFVDLPGRSGTLDGTTYVVPAVEGVPGVTVSLFDRPAGVDAAAISRQLVAGLEPPVETFPVEVTVPDAVGVYYARPGADHGLVGVIAPSAESTAVVILVQGSGTMGQGTATVEDTVAALAATNLGLIALGRVCAPGQSADGAGPIERFNAYCAADL